MRPDMIHELIGIVIITLWVATVTLCMVFLAGCLVVVLHG